jgi:serine/threonine protein kinase
MTNYSGQSIGRYHVIERLGEGGMAIVYKAYDTQLECDVAIKFIRTEKLSGENSAKVLKRFKIEAKKTAALMHPNIIPVIEFREDEGAPYLVMKYLPGGTLKNALIDRLKNGEGPYHYREAAALLVPIAQALDHSHQNGIIHRDVKPSNVLMTHAGQPMLTDFGVAKIIETGETMDQTGLGVGIGTPEYMAPEQWEGKEIDGRADVYALGVIFYELITGRVPYKADTVAAILVKVLHDPLPRPREYNKDIPESIEKVLFKALAKKPDDRYSTMGAFAAALEKLATNVNLGPGYQPNGTRIWAVLTISLVIIAISGWIIYSKGTVGKPNTLAVVSIEQSKTTVDIKTVEPTILSSASTSTIGIKNNSGTLSKDLVINKIVVPTFTLIPVATQSITTLLPSPPIDIRPTSGLISGATISYSTDFNSSTEFIENWLHYNNVVLNNGIVTISGNSGIGRNNHLSIGSGFLVLFRCSTGTESNIVFFNSRTYGTKYIGIRPNFQNLMTSIGSDNQWIGGQQFTGKLVIVPNHWYYGLVETKPKGEFYLKVWDKNNPSLFREKDIQMGNNWDNETWYGSITTNGNNLGKIEIDSFQELQFK